MRRCREGWIRPPADRPITSEPVGMRRSKGGVCFGACTGVVRPFSPRSRGGERLRVRQVGSFGFLWAEPAGSFGRRARTRRRGGRVAGARQRRRRTFFQWTSPPRSISRRTSAASPRNAAFHTSSAIFVLSLGSPYVDRTRACHRRAGHHARARAASLVARNSIVDSKLKTHLW